VKIDKRLNFVVPIYGDEQPLLDDKRQPVVKDGRPVMHEPVVAHVHSTPLSVELVDRYFMTLAQTYSAIFSRGLGIAGGPAIAMRLLRQIAMENNAWADGPDGSPGVERGLVEEVRRLTNVAALVDGSWQQVPLKVAAQRGVIDDEDVSEVENAIVFFICISAVLNRSMRRPMLEAAAELWGAQITSSSCSELMSSLLRSRGTGNSGETSPAPGPAAPSRGGGSANATLDGKPSSVPV